MATWWGSSPLAVVSSMTPCLAPSPVRAFSDKFVLMYLQEEGGCLRCGLGLSVNLVDYWYTTQGRQWLAGWGHRARLD